MLHVSITCVQNLFEFSCAVFKVCEERVCAGRMKTVHEEEETGECIFAFVGCRLALGAQSPYSFSVYSTLEMASVVFEQREEVVTAVVGKVRWVQIRKQLIWVRQLWKKI